MKKVEYCEENIIDLRRKSIEKQIASENSSQSSLQNSNSFDEAGDDKFFKMVGEICQDDSGNNDEAENLDTCNSMSNELLGDEACTNKDMPSDFLDDSELAIPSESLMHEIQQLVEYYLSDSYLVGNSFLLKHVQNNRLGYVSLKLMASFKRLAGITDHKILAVAISRSQKLQLNDNWSRVRRIAPVPSDIVAGHKNSLKCNTSFGRNSDLSTESLEHTSPLVEEECKKSCGKNFVAICNLPRVSSAPGSTPEHSTPFGAVVECLKPFFAHILSVTLIRPKCPVPLRFKDWVIVQQEFRSGCTIAIAEFTTCEAAENMVEHINTTQTDPDANSIKVRLCNPRVRLNRKEEKRDYSPCYHLNIKNIRSNSLDTLSMNNVPSRHHNIEEVDQHISGSNIVDNRVCSLNSLFVSTENIAYNNNWISCSDNLDSSYHQFYDPSKDSLSKMQVYNHPYSYNDYYHNSSQYYQ